MATLSVSIAVAGEPEAIQHEFQRLPVTFGRHAHNDVRLAGRFVSNFHARVELRQGRLCVLDSSSTNGTHVESREAGRLQRLAPGVAHVFESSTEFWIGPYRLTLNAGELEERPGLFEPVRAGLSSLSLPLLPGAPGVGSSRVNDAVAPEAAAECPNTRALSTLSPEAVALRGLQELVDSLAPGCSLATAGDVARLVTRVHATLEAFCHGFASISAAQREQLAQLARACQLEVQPRSREAAPRPRDVAAAILDFRSEATPHTPDLASALSRLLAQEAILLDGVIDGIGALLSDLDPARIEAEVRGQPWRFDVARRSRHWEAYRKCYAELSQRKGALPRVFGTALARAYAVHEARRVERAREG